MTNIKEKGKIELGFSEYEPDNMLKTQITNTLLTIDTAILNMEGNYSHNVVLLISGLIGKVKPYEKQEAMFQLRNDLIEEATAEIFDTDEKNKMIMEINMRILGLCMDHFGDRYMEKRVSVML